MKISLCLERSHHYLLNSFSVSVLACLIASAHISGCSKPSGSIGSDAIKTEVRHRTEIHPLVGSRWELAGVRNFSDVASEPLPHMEILFNKAQLQIVICNRIEADYALHLGAELYLSNLVTTEIYCNASTAKLESFFISKRILYDYDKDMFTLHNEMGSMLLLKPAAGK